MPTVKLHSSGKVILKDGKVSCSCCAAPETCCMYPADGLDVTYTADDLPDAVTFDPGYGEITLTRSGDTYAGGGYTLIPGMAAGWYLSDAEPTKEWDSSCLFGTYGSLRPLSHGSTTVEDQFADAYAVAFNANALAIECEVTRESLCVWSKYDLALPIDSYFVYVDVFLRAGYYDNDGLHRWSINIVYSSDNVPEEISITPGDYTWFGYKRYNGDEWSPSSDGDNQSSPTHGSGRYGSEYVTVTP